MAASNLFRGCWVFIFKNYRVFQNLCRKHAINRMYVEKLNRPVFVKNIVIHLLHCKNMRKDAFSIIFSDSFRKLSNLFPNHMIPEFVRLKR